MDQWKVILATLMIFGSGVGTGYLMSRSSSSESKGLLPTQTQLGAGQLNPGSVQRTTRPVRPVFFRSSGYLDRHLGLSEEQKAQIQDITKKSHQRIYEFGKPFRDQLRSEHMEVQKQIRQVLIPEQVITFDNLPHSRFKIDPGRPPGRPPRFPGRPGPEDNGIGPSPRSIKPPAKSEQEPSPTKKRTILKTNSLT